MGSANAAGTSASFGFPAGVVTTGGILFVCDSFNSTIRAINLSTGVVTTLAGVPGITGWYDNATTPVLAAFFNHPEGIATDGTNLYVADSGNNAIRKIAIATGLVTTIAGNPNVLPGSTDGIGSSALFNNPLGICINSAGSTLYVTDSGNSTIRVVPANGTSTTSTIAGHAEVFGSADGTGTAATFTYPQGIVIDTTNTNLYIADTGNNTIRKLVISGAGVTTLAGQVDVKGDVDGTGTSAVFDWPEGIAIDASGNLYVADTLNDVVRQVVIASGAVTTFAGQGELVGSADGAGSVATFNHPTRLVVDAASLYVADTYNETIRRITPVP